MSAGDLQFPTREKIIFTVAATLPRELFNLESLRIEPFILTNFTGLLDPFAVELIEGYGLEHARKLAFTKTALREVSIVSVELVVRALVLINAFLAEWVVTVMQLGPTTDRRLVLKIEPNLKCLLLLLSYLRDQQRTILFFLLKSLTTQLLLFSQIRFGVSLGYSAQCIPFLLQTRSKLRQKSLCFLRQLPQLLQVCSLLLNTLCWL